MNNLEEDNNYIIDLNSYNNNNNFELCSDSNLPNIFQQTFPNIDNINDLQNIRLNDDIFMLLLVELFNNDTNLINLDYKLLQGITQILQLLEHQTIFKISIPNHINTYELLNDDQFDITYNSNKLIITPFVITLIKSLYTGNITSNKGIFEFANLNILNLNNLIVNNIFTNNLFINYKLFTNNLYSLSMVNYLNINNNIINIGISSSIINIFNKPIIKNDNNYIFSKSLFQLNYLESGYLQSAINCGIIINNNISILTNDNATKFIISMNDNKYYINTYDNNFNMNIQKNTLLYKTVIINKNLKLSNSIFNNLSIKNLYCTNLFSKKIKSNNVIIKNKLICYNLSTDNITCNNLNFTINYLKSNTLNSNNIIFNKFNLTILLDNYINNINNK